MGLTRQDADRIVAGYDAERYARDLPDRLIDDLRAARETPENRLELPQRRTALPDEGDIEYDVTTRSMVCRHPEALTRRQRETLALASHGMENAEIAEILGVAPDTTKAHLRSAYALLAAKNRAHAVALALRYGMIA